VKHSAHQKRRISEEPNFMKQSILIVDDDPSITVSLEILLRQAGYVPFAVSRAPDALERIETAGCDLVLQDMNFSRNTSGKEGLALLKQIKSLRPDLPVILITAWGSIQLAVEGIRAGAADFITKPWSNDQLLQAVSTALGLAAARERTADAGDVSREEIDRKGDFRSFIGEDPQVLRILDLITRVSVTDASVLITGESGTGKELLAEVIHRNSPRREKPFIKVNLGGIPTSLFESEMFGHVKGAFTDAHRDRTGRFPLADGGTIFLDEIGDLESGAQVKLLRVLQDRTFEVLGTSQTRRIDVRVVSATNHDLSRAVDEGTFREDLLYRLNLISLHLPALRQRSDDIPPLARHFLQRLATTYRRQLALTPAAECWLMEQPWPGNVRQLMQTIERTVLMSDEDVITPEAIRRTMAVGGREATRRVLPEVNAMTLDELERAMILKSLRYYDGHITKAAKALGISRAALYRRMEKYGISF
jgi:DNA-binding NtrC family response regulator